MSRVGCSVHPTRREAIQGIRPGLRHREGTLSTTSLAGRQLAHVVALPSTKLLVAAPKVAGTGETTVILPLWSRNQAALPEPARLPAHGGHRLRLAMVPLVSAQQASEGGLRWADARIKRCRRCADVGGFGPTLELVHQVTNWRRRWLAGTAVMDTAVSAPTGCTPSPQGNVIHATHLARADLRT